MIYIRVPIYYDNIMAKTKSRLYTRLYEGELLTIKEYASLLKHFRTVPDLTGYGVELNKDDTVIFFDSRVAIYTKQGQVQGTPVPQEEIKKLVEERLAELNKGKQS